MNFQLLKTSRFLFATIACLAFATLGCTKDSSEKSNGGTGGNGNGGSSNGGGASGSSTLQCGVVSGGDLVYPDLEDGQFVRVVSVLSNNIVVVADADTGQNRVLVKIQGLGNAISSYKNQESINRIERMTQSGAVFFKATDDCNVVLDNGGQGTIGSLLTVNGESIAEDLIANDFAPADTNDACSGSLLGSCLQDLESNSEQETRGELKTSFLWKPVSDSDGSLVVLVYECDVRVTVNGEELRHAGAGNGRCSTMRGNRPGCAYGAAVVKVTDRNTGLPYTHNGSTEIRIPNGCQRFEF